jgi:hypothetical protein
MNKKRILNIIFAIILVSTVTLPMTLSAMGVLQPEDNSSRLVLALGVFLVSPVVAIRLIFKD